MKVVIRLQNHGKRNHPLWWVVAAPNRKNIFGPFLEHLGYWYPREGISVKRQVILNLVRIKYWISCGAVPTPRVQHFLNWYGLMPKPWFYPSMSCLT
jgi:small subunit ribosomal protein S16